MYVKNEVSKNNIHVHLQVDSPSSCWTCCDWNHFQCCDNYFYYKHDSSVDACGGNGGSGGDGGDAGLPGKLSVYGTANINVNNVQIAGNPGSKGLGGPGAPGKVYKGNYEANR